MKRPAKPPPGRYDASLTFPMRGRWTGTVKVIEPGQPAVAIPVSFDVE
ncbi:MAG: hypothetical protein M3276_04505 [Actinomycetota bacterium]|nr:hypothetical protein [Actinomycetota bacterium]